MTGLTRETLETRIRVAMDSAAGAGADRGAEPGNGAIATGDPFLDHMMVTLARYADLPLRIEARGDLRHHLVEDTAITLGALLARETPATCARYGHAVIPMDEALVEVALDIGGRPHYEGRLPSRLYEHFFRSMSLHAGWTLHVRVLRGSDRHHIVEAAFKALGLALRAARREGGGVFSTKGSVRTGWEVSDAG
jgi:imidazoleglycerol-phosphate dehydratase